MLAISTLPCSKNLFLVVFDEAASMKEGYWALQRVLSFVKRPDFFCVVMDTKASVQFLTPALKRSEYLH